MTHCLGTFGSSDFIHSLLGGQSSSFDLTCDAYTHLNRKSRGHRSYRELIPRACLHPHTHVSRSIQSQVSVSDLNSELEKARAKSGGTRDGSSSTLRSLLISIPGGNDGEMQRQMDSIDRIRAGPNQPGGKRPEDMSPQELHSVLWQVLTFRDSGGCMCALC